MIMKKAIIATTILAVILAGLFALNALSPTYPETASTVPYVVVDDRTFYFSTLCSDPTLPDGSVLLETVNDATGCTNSKSVITHGIEVGSEIYQNADYPGWVYTLKGGTLRRFTVWELACPMIRYNNEIYISVDYFMNCGDTKEHGPLSPSRFTEMYEPAGRLFFRQYDVVPSQDFETNLELYNNSQLHSAKNDDSTVYVELSDADGFIWKEAFYKASKIPLDYTF